MTHLESQLAVGAILFALGAIGFLTRRNLILMMLSAETMLHGVSINLTAFGRYHNNASGQVFTIFVLTVAACEAGLALALILTLYQRRKSLDVDLWGNLGEPDLPKFREDEAPAPALLPHPDLPRLTPAGPMPKPQSGVKAKV
ncbi:MAG: NADH-quinone oxidoreductase subunit K [Planctomycetales bacterium 12-60-4]|nr:MAG: NADH-quinone oxidoreductase subunit K [Planctomycetales bacterium 12-60-4]